MGPLLARLAIGLGIVACVGCRSANPTPPPPSHDTHRVSTASGEQNLQGLTFDPMGADFSRWITHFSREVYRNWIMPQPALMGMRAHVDIEFRVERDGTLSLCQVINSSTNKAMDKAAKAALEKSRFMALPDDYGPSNVTMRASFFYNESAAGRD